MPYADDDNEGPPSPVPSRESAGVFRSKLELSPDETLLAIALPLLVAGAVVNYSHYGINDVLATTIVSMIMLGVVIRQSEHNHTPYALVMRETRVLESRLRMPLLPGDARRKTGVRATGTTPGGNGYLRRDDETLVAIVGGEPRNTTRYSPADWGGLAWDVAESFDTAIAKEGITCQLQTSRTYSEGTDVVSLDALAGDESAREDARAFAAATAENTREWEHAAGVMDSSPKVAVAVGTDETGTARRGAGRGIFGTTPDTTEAQEKLLDKRVRAATALMGQMATGAEAYSEGEIREALRAAWRPHDDPIPQDPAEASTADDTVLWGPHGVNEKRDHVVLSPSDPESTDYVSSLWVSSWPGHLSPGILADALSTPGLRLEFAVYPADCDREDKITDLDDRIRLLRRRMISLLSERGLGGEKDADDADMIEGEVEDLRDHLREDEVEGTEGTVIFTVRADSREAVLSARSTLRTRLRKVGCSATPADGDQLAAFRSTTPIVKDDLTPALHSRLSDLLSSVARNVHIEMGTPTAHDMPSGAIGCLAHAIHGVRQDEDGVIYGLAQGTHRRLSDVSTKILQICRDDLNSPHRYIIGRSGWGKTFFESVNSTEELLRDRGADQLMILDIAENFEGVIHTLGGEKVVFGESLINPFAAGREHGVDLVTDLICVLLAEEDPEDAPSRSRVRKTVLKTYDRVEAADTGRDIPVFDDYFDLLEGVQGEEIDLSVRGTSGELADWAQDARILLGQLSQFDTGGEFGFMSPDLDAGDPVTGDVPLDERVLLFDGSEFQDRGGAAKAMLAVMYLSIAYRKSDGEEKVLCVVDEAHSVFRLAAQAGLFEEMVRAGRNRGLCFDFLSQADDDFSVDEALVIAKQASVLIAGDVGSEADPEDIMSFGIPEQEAELICGGLKMGGTSNAAGQSEDYSEAVVSVEGDIYLVEFEVHDLVSDMVTFEATEEATAAGGEEQWRVYMDDSLAATEVTG